MPPVAPNMTCKPLVTARFLPSLQLLACHANAQGIMPLTPEYPRNVPAYLGAGGQQSEAQTTCKSRA